MSEFYSSFSDYPDQASLTGFPDPFFDYASTAMPTTWRDALRWCFAVGALVELDGKRVVPIEEVEPGNLVYTCDGDIRRVIARSSRYVSENIYSIVTATIPCAPIRVTEEHPLYVIPSKAEIKADALRLLPAKELRGGDWLVSRKPTRNPSQIDVPDEVCWLLGLEFAVGNKHSLSLPVAKESVPGIYDDIIKRLRSLARANNISISVASDSEKCTVSWHVPRKYEKLFFRIAEHSWDILSSFSDDKLIYFIGGVIDAAAVVQYKTPNGTVQQLGVSLPFDRLYLLQQLLHSLDDTIFARISVIAGYDLPVLCFYPKKPLSFRSAFRLASCVVLALDDSAFSWENDVLFRVREVDKKWILHEIVSVKQEYYVGEVHNLNVEGTGSYTVNGVHVHNCEYIMMRNGIYRSAMERMLSYFITDIVVADVDRKSQREYLDYMNDVLGLPAFLRLVGLDYLTYGNSIISVISPTRRYAYCPHCQLCLPFRELDPTRSGTVTFDWQTLKVKHTCPKCKKPGAWHLSDDQKWPADGLKLKRWNIHEIDLIWDPFTDDIAHVWRIPAYYKAHLQQGHSFQLERAPIEVLEAVKNNQYILLNKKNLFHAKEDSLCGLLLKGWGISRVFTNFNQAWYVQVLHRTNEAIGLDYIIPFRVITPAPRAGIGQISDPAIMTDLGDFRAQVSSLLHRHRQNPTGWHVLPFPIQYQTLGGEAAQMPSHQLLEQGVDLLLSSAGIFVEFFRGTMAINSAPIAFRLLESCWSHLVRILNRVVQWIADQMSRELSWDPAKCYLERPSHADDLNRQLARLQLMMAQGISQTTGLKSIGLNLEDEQKQMIEEQKMMAEMAQKAQEELEASQLGKQMAQGMMAGGMPMGGGMPMDGGMPMGGAGGMPASAPAAGPVDPVQAVIADLPVGTATPLSPQELDQIANIKAQQIYAMPSTYRISALRKLKQVSEIIWALTKSKLEQLDEAARRQGQVAGQQMAQQQASPIQIPQ